MAGSFFLRGNDFQCSSIALIMIYTSGQGGQWNSRGSHGTHVPPSLVDGNKFRAPLLQPIQVLIVMNCRKFPRFYCFTDFPQRVSLPSSSSSQWKGLRKCSTRTWFSPKQTASWSDHDSGKKKTKTKIWKKKSAKPNTVDSMIGARIAPILLNVEQAPVTAPLTGVGNNSAV